MIENNNRIQKKYHLKIYKVILSTLFKEKDHSFGKDELIEKIRSNKAKRMQTGLINNHINETLILFQKSNFITCNNNFDNIHLTSLGEDIISSLLKQTRNNHKRNLRIQYRLILTKIFADKNKRIHENQIDRNIQFIGKSNNIRGLRNKSDNLQAIKSLYESNLVDIDKDNDGIKKIVSLSFMGKEVSTLITNLIRYNEAYFELSELLEEKLFCIQENVIPFLVIDNKHHKKNIIGDKEVGLKDEIRENAHHRLIEKGWKAGELEYYIKVRTILIDLKNICDRNFPFMALLLYSNLINKYNLKENSKSFRIIKDLVLDQFNTRNEITLKNYEKELRGYCTIKFMKDEYNSFIPLQTGNILRLSEDIDKIFSELKDHKVPSIMKDSVINMKNSYFELLRDKDDRLHIV